MHTAALAPARTVKLAKEKTLDSHLVQAVTWTGTVKLASQLLTWASTIIAVRLLTPEDYGLVALALTCTGLVSFISEFGLGTSIVTLLELTTDQIAQLNTLSLIMGGVGFAALCAAALPIGHFFSAPEELPWIVVVMGSGSIIGAFRTVPCAVLQKELKFRLLAFIEASQALVTALSTVALALAGLAYWALVLGTLLGTAVSTGMTLFWRPHRFGWPHFGPLRYVCTFSWYILVSRLSWYIQSNADFVVAGRVLGADALGAYRLAWSLAHIPIDKVGSFVTRVTPAFFSAVQTDYTALKRYTLVLTEGLALAVFPATLGLAIVANDLVLLLLGEKWVGAIVPLQLLALHVLFCPISAIVAQVLYTVREQRFGMQLGIIGAVGYPAAFYLGSYWGAAGIAAAWTIVHPLATVFLCRRVFRKIRLPAGHYLRSLWPAVSGSVLMAVVVLVTERLIPPAWSLSTRLGLEILGGAVAYTLAMVGFYRNRLLAFYRVTLTAFGTDSTEEKNLWRRLACRYATSS